MAEIDNLSIQISANADSAEKSINGLIGSLRKLNQNLALGNVSTFARQMREITNSANGLKEVSSTISSIATAGRKLGDLSGYKTLNDQIRETESETKKLAKSIAESFDFKENGTEKAKQNIKDLTMLIGMMFDKLGNGKGISQKADMFAAMLPNMQGFKNVLDEDYQAIKNFADEYKVFVNATQKGDLEHLFGSLKEASQITGIKFVDNQELAKFKNLEEYLGRIKELVGIDFMKGAANPIEGVKNLQHYFEEYAKSAEQAMQASMPDSSFYKAEGEKLARTVEDIYKRIYDESATKNPFAGITEGLKSLDGVKIPNLDSLNQLATDLEKISKIDAKSISAVATALNKFGKVNGDSAKKVVDAVSEVKRKASKKGNIELVDEESIGRAKDQLGQLYEEQEKLNKQIRDFRHGKSDASDDEYNAMKEQIASVADEISKLENGSQAIDVVEQKFESVRGVIGELYSEQAKLKQSISDFKAGKLNVPDEEYKAWSDRLKEVSASLKELDGGKAAEAVEKIGDAAEKSVPKLSRLEEKVQTILHFGFNQDGASFGMAEILRDIQRYSQEISDMKAAPQIFDIKLFEEFSSKLHLNKKLWEEFEKSVNRKIRIGGGLDEASRELQRVSDRMRDIKQARSEMENGSAGWNLSQYKALGEELEKLQERYDELLGKQEEVANPKGGNNLNLLANLVALGHEIGNIANAFDKLANYGIKGLKLAFKPLEHVIDEYKEKIKSIGDAFKGFTDRAKKELNKLSAFWKRSMKTFTFMLVRKAITAVITEVSDAVKSLALWSKQFGTIFNDSMSHITSNLSYIARSIVGAFEPIINAIVPAFNALSDAIARAAAKLGEFFAAMTGQGYYMAAKKQVTDYAESVDKANKAQKNLIAGLDDLNVITTPTSTSSGIEDVADQWEKIDVSDKMKDWVNQIKDLAKRLFAPIKNAWDKTKDHVIGGWKYMTGEIKKLLKDIGRDFLKVWEQPATQRIFENLFNTIGNIEEAIGHLARNFREAWNYNDNGLHILENIRDIILNISEHVLHMSEAFKKWADDLDFKPLLTAFEEFTRKVQPLIDFIGNLIEDWWERVILRHWKWLIEEGIPHLLKVLGEVIDAFNFDKIRKDLQPVMDAFETMRENIETGIVNAFGNLGKAIAKFANSKEFTDFTKNVAWFMEQITAERVEKLFTALGTAILDTAEALMRFVGSDKFKKFMEALFKWYDSLSVEDIAGFIRKIALAIAAFKFVAFVGKGFSGFLSFLSILTSGKGILKIAGNLLGGIGKAIGNLFGGIGKLLGGAGKGIAGALSSLIPKEGAIAKIFEVIGGLFKTVGAVILKGALIVALVTAISLVINNWDKIEPVLRTLAQAIFKGIGMALGGLAHFLGTQIAEALGHIFDYFKESCEEVGGNIIAGILWGILKAVAGIVTWLYENVVKPFIDGFKKGFGIHSPAETMIPIGEFLIGGMLQGILAAIAGIGTWLYEHVVQPILTFFEGAAEWLIDGGKAIIEGIKNGIDAAKEGLAEKWQEIKDEAAKWWRKVCDDAEKWWGDIKDTIHGIAEDLRKNLEDKWSEVKQNAIDAWEQFKSDASDKWEQIKNTIHDIAKELRRKLYERWEDVKREGSRAWDSFKTTAQQKWNSIKDTIIGIANNIKSLLDGVWSNIQTAAQNAWNTVKTNAENVWNNIKTSAEQIWGSIKDTIVGFAQSAAEEASHKFWDLVGWASDAFHGVVNAASSILSGTSGAISSALSGVSGAVSSAFSGVKDVVSGALSGAVDSARSLGEKVASGFAQGTNSQQSKNNWLSPTNNIKKAIENAKKTLGVHSPSKVFEEIGENVVEGFNIGIEESEKSTEKEMNDWMKKISNIDLPKFDFDAALPKSSLRMDSYSHADFSGTASFDEQALQTSMRSAIQESIGSLILPYLNDIANSSRETANKNLTISAKDVHTAVRVEDKRFKTQTGRSAFAY